MNPIQGIIRGEAILEGDASAGVDLTLYAVTPSWETIVPDSNVLASGGLFYGSNSYVDVIGGAPFITAMISKIITFTDSGPATIVNVVSSTSLLVAGDFSLMENETFSIAGQEGLREIELDENDELRITDVFISQEKDSEYALVSGEDAPGKRVAKGRLLETGSINLRFETPFICSSRRVKYFGNDNGLNVCLIHGYIT